MPKDIVRKGLLAVIPPFVAMHAFLYVANKSGIPEYYLTFIKTPLKAIFFLSVIAPPVYFCLKERQPLSLSLKKMIGILAISWGAFVALFIFTAFLQYPGLLHEMERTAANALYVFVISYFVLFPPLAFGCTIIAVIGNRLISTSRRPKPENST